MKIFVILLFLVISMVQIGETSVPINQIIINAMYCNNSLPLVECNIRVQRKSKTAQMLSGNFTIKAPWTSDVSGLWTISYQDYSGTWKGLVMRNMDKTCDLYFTEGGMLFNQRKKYLTETKDGCPAEPGAFVVEPATINRYRKDWEPDLKKLIPPFFLEADNWRSKAVYYHKDDPKTALAEITIDLRLINDHMSQ